MIQSSNIQKNRLKFNQSIFFSTQVSTSPRLSLSSILNRSQQQKQVPNMYYRKIKQQYKQSKIDFQQSLQQNHRVKVKLQKIEVRSARLRCEFMKLYNNRKFEIQEESMLQQRRLQKMYNKRMKESQIKSFRIREQVSMKQQKLNKLMQKDQFRENKQKQIKIFRQNLRNNNQKYIKMVSDSCNKIKKQRAFFLQNKRNRSELASTKSKFNYVNKINEQLVAIKYYQDKLQKQSQRYIINQQFVNPQERFYSS